jgi:hypothetical protein
MSTYILTPRSGPPTPDQLFDQDLITDEREFPIMFRPGFDPIWEVVLKDTPDPREPDIVTARTKAFLVGWKKTVPVQE